MANMGYCRFQNTAGDLGECYDHWDDELSEEEARARKRILRLCEEILRESKDTINALRDEIRCLQTALAIAESSRNTWMRKATGAEMVRCGGCGEMVEASTAAWEGRWGCPECRRGATKRSYSELHDAARALLDVIPLDDEIAESRALRLCVWNDDDTKAEEEAGG